MVIGWECEGSVGVHGKVEVASTTAAEGQRCSISIASVWILIVTRFELESPKRSCRKQYLMIRIEFIESKVVLKGARPVFHFQCAMLGDT